MNLYKGLWAGIAFDTGGEILVGVNHQQGLLISCEDLAAQPERTRYMTFDQTNTTIGLGIGGSFGASFMIGLNAATPMDFDGASRSADLSIEFGIGKLGDYIRTMPEYLKFYYEFAEGLQGSLVHLADGPEKYDDNAYLLKDIADGVLKNNDGIVSASNGEPALLAFPIPGTGYGIRFSLKMKFETTDVYPQGVLKLG